MDIADTILAKSDQINASDLVAGPITVTIQGADVDPRKQQPVDLHLLETPGKVYRPNKSMRLGLVKCWGPKSAEYTGRRITLYFDPDTLWKGQKVGGIKISHASHIAEPVTFPILVARNPVPFTIQPLPDRPAPPPIPDDVVTLEQFHAYYRHRADNGADPAELAAIQAAAPQTDNTPTKENTNA